jgi:hypothetical protein
MHEKKGKSAWLEENEDEEWAGDESLLAMRAAI